MPYTCDPSYLGDRGRTISSSKSVHAKLARPYLKKKIIIIKKKRELWA
jgi:hypothetical protein